MQINKKNSLDNEISPWDYVSTVNPYLLFETPKPKTENPNTKALELETSKKLLEGIKQTKYEKNMKNTLHDSNIKINDSLLLIENLEKNECEFFIHYENKKMKLIFNKLNTVENFFNEIQNLFVFDRNFRNDCIISHENQVISGETNIIYDLIKTNKKQIEVIIDKYENAFLLKMISTLNFNDKVKDLKYFLQEKFGIGARERILINKFYERTSDKIYNFQKNKPNRNIQNDDRLKAVVCIAENLFGIKDKINECLIINQDLYQWSFILKLYFEGLNHFKYCDEIIYGSNLYFVENQKVCPIISKFSRKNNLQEEDMVYRIYTMSAKKIPKFFINEKLIKHEDMLIYPNTLYYPIKQENNVTILQELCVLPRTDKIVFWVDDWHTNNYQYAREIESNNNNKISFLFINTTENFLEIYQYLLNMFPNNYLENSVLITNMKRKENEIVEPIAGINLLRIAQKKKIYFKKIFIFCQKAEEKIQICEKENFDFKKLNIDITDSVDNLLLEIEKNFE